MINQKRIWSSSQLPTLPGVAARLLELTKDPETEIRQVIEVISTDPAISAKILKAANSSFFGLSSEVRTIDRAVPLLGTTVSTSLALSFSLTDDAMSRGPMVEHYQSYWRQSIVQACAAELLAHRRQRAQAGEYFLCGLLLDLGRLAMLKTIPGEYAKVLKDLEGSLVAREREILGFCHVEIGAKLMEHWKLPQVISQACRLHHASQEELAACRNLPQADVFIAMAAAAAVGDYVCAATKGEALDRLRKLAKLHWSMTAEEVDQLLYGVDERFKQAGEVFKVDMSQLGSPSDLMVEANEQLAQLTLREHLASTQAAVRQQTVEAEMRVLESKNEQLQQQALHDPLTKLYNRRFFDESMSKELFRCMRTASPVGVIFGDIDHFKKLNDTHGHQFGDQVLQRVAELFLETARNSDTVGRYGGEEFVILVGSPTEAGIERFAERIRQRIAQEPFLFNGEAVPVTISLGASLMVPGRSAKECQKDLLAAADACLYESKSRGRDCVTVRSLIPTEQRELLLKVSQQKFSRWLAAKRLLDISTLSKVLVNCPPQAVKIGELAIRHEMLTPQHVEDILAIQANHDGRFGEIACMKGWLTENQLAQLLAWQQENPKQLAAELIRQGVLQPPAVAASLEDYLQSLTEEVELATA